MLLYQLAGGKAKHRGVLMTSALESNDWGLVLSFTIYLLRDRGRVFSVPQSSLLQDGIIMVPALNK